MSLRETFEKMAIDLADEIVALVLDTSVREVAESGRRQPRRVRRPPQDHVPDAAVDQVLQGDGADTSIDAVTPSHVPVEPDVLAPEDLASEPVSEPATEDGQDVVPATVSLTFSSEGTVVVPVESRAVRIDDLVISTHLSNALLGHGYLTLGDLDGRSVADVSRIRRLGRTCMKELRGLLRVQPPPKKRVTRKEHEPDGLQPDLPRKAIEDVVSVSKAIASSGPPEKRGLFDALDIALDQLTEHRRHVLLLRFGGTGETPLTQEEAARRTGHSPSRLGQVQKKALANVRFFAGPDFARELLELEHRVVHGGADLLEELSRVGRTDSNQGQRHPWDLPAFYARLLAALAPGLAAPKAEPGPFPHDAPESTPSPSDPLPFVPSRPLAPPVSAR
jgi:hypothetical protein